MIQKSNRKYKNPKGGLLEGFLGGLNSFWGKLISVIGIFSMGYAFGKYREEVFRIQQQIEIESKLNKEYFEMRDQMFDDKQLLINEISELKHTIYLYQIKYEEKRAERNR